MIRSIVFDFDGVLVDSVNIKTEAFARLFDHEGPEVLEKVVAYHLENGGVSRVEKFRYYYGDILKRSLSDGELSELCRRFHVLVFDGVIKAPWVAGVPEALDQCLKDGYVLFIVSGTPEEELRVIVQHRGIGFYFSGIYGSPPVKKEHLERILASYDLSPKEVLYVGDSRSDYEAAKDTGVNFVAIGASDHLEEWAKLGVKMLQSMRELRSYMRQEQLWNPTQARVEATPVRAQK